MNLFINENASGARARQRPPPAPRRGVDAGKRCRAMLGAVLLGLGATAGTAAADTAVVTELIATGSMEPNTPSISADGRYVALAIFRANQTGTDVYVHDRVTGERQQVNLTSAGLPMKGSATVPVISADGRTVLFASNSADLGVAAGSAGYFAYDRVKRTTEAVVNPPDRQVWTSMYPAISPDGRYAAYRLIGNTTTTFFVRDMLSKTTEQTGAAATTITSTNERMSVSADGRYLAYRGKEGRAAIQPQPYVHDRLTGATELVNVNGAGVPGNLSAGVPSMSADGNVVAFATTSSNLLPNDKDSSTTDVYVRDRRAGTTTRLSFGLGSSGELGPSVSADGRYVAFHGQSATGKRLYRYDLLSKTYRSALAPLISSYGQPKMISPAISADGRYVSYDLLYEMIYQRAKAFAVADFGAPPGIALSSAALALTEGGAAATYTVVLNQAPAADVSVTVVPDAQLSVSASVLTFTPASWNTPQTVSVEAPQNGRPEGKHNGIIRHVTESADPDYRVVAAVTLDVAIADSVVPIIASPKPDALWRQPDLTASGSATPGATLLLVASNLGSGAVHAASTVVEASGAWHQSLPGLGDGVYELQAEADAIKSAAQTLTIALPRTAIDISALVTTYSSGMTFNRNTSRYSGSYSITNASAGVLAGPFQVRFDQLPAGINMVNANGINAGAPFVTVIQASLAPGATFTFPVLFHNPGKIGMSYSTATFSGNF